EGNVRVVLFSYFDFIDRFSIFRNLYYILIGFYFILAGLLVKERIWPNSIFLLIFSLYGFKFEDIIKALKSII
ncbi:hypothetical protein QBC45DRAFT_325161, partial [Copromyces sp. CBS 386.78]